MNTTATLNWNAMAGANSYDAWYKIAGSASWNKMVTAGTSLGISSLNPGTAYRWRVRSDCSPLKSGRWTAIQAFTTTTGGARIGFTDPSFTDLLVYPNPSQGRITIRYSLESAADLHIYDPVGRLVYDQMRLEHVDLIVDLAQFGSGMYLVRLTSGSRVIMKKVLVD